VSDIGPRGASLKYALQSGPASFVVVASPSPPPHALTMETLSARHAIHPRLLVIIFLFFVQDRGRCAEGLLGLSASRQIAHWQTLAKGGYHEALDNGHALGLGCGAAEQEREVRT
jgi:hypothetical protein